LKSRYEMISRGRIIKDVARKTGRQYEYAAEIFDAIFDTIKGYIIDGDGVYIKEFAKIDVAVRPERLARNPKTDEVQLYPATKVIHCKFSDKLKQAVKGEES